MALLQWLSKRLKASRTIPALLGRDIVPQSSAHVTSQKAQGPTTPYSRKPLHCPWCKQVDHERKLSGTMEACISDLWIDWLTMILLEPP